MAGADLSIALLPPRSADPAPEDEAHRSLCPLMLQAQSQGFWGWALFLCCRDNSHPPVLPGGTHHDSERDLSCTLASKEQLEECSLEHACRAGKLKAFSLHSQLAADSHPGPPRSGGKMRSLCFPWLCCDLFPPHCSSIERGDALELCS